MEILHGLEHSCLRTQVMVRVTGVRVRVSGALGKRVYVRGPSRFLKAKSHVYRQVLWVFTYPQTHAEFRAFLLWCGLTDLWFTLKSITHSERLLRAACRWCSTVVVLHSLRRRPPPSHLFLSPASSSPFARQEMEGWKRLWKRREKRQADGDSSDLFGIDK